MVNDSKLSKTEKIEALDTWEQDARQLMTASNEGMPGPKEGVEPHDHHQMDRILRAKVAGFPTFALCFVSKNRDSQPMNISTVAAELTARLANKFHKAA